MRKCVCGLVKCKRGVTSIEYALIASLIAMVIISAVTLVGTSVSAAFQSVAGGF